MFPFLVHFCAIVSKKCNFRPFPTEIYSFWPFYSKKTSSLVSPKNHSWPPVQKVHFSSRYVNRHLQILLSEETLYWIKNISETILWVHLQWIKHLNPTTLVYKYWTYYIVTSLFSFALCKVINVRAYIHKSAPAAGGKKSST